MIRLLVALLIVVFAVLQYQFWAGRGGLIDFASLQVQLDSQSALNEKLKERNRVLKAEVFDLKRGYEAIEERGRADFGLIMKGETFYQIVESQNKNAKQK